MMRTRWRFGSNRRFVAIMEWLRLLPNEGLRLQTEQTRDIGSQYALALLGTQMGTVDDTPAGRITIGDDVVAEIVGLTVLECYGVVGMAGKRLVHGVARLLGRDGSAAGVEVERGGDGDVVVAVHVVMESGLNLAEVSESLRSRISYEVERLCGIVVSAVTVHIHDVRRESS
ncbi:MAG: hypothetical protein QOE98_2459 [Gaiellaceae bacterium]|nr:hypothetical protein [Gaiellaceae bacterium]